MHNDYGLIKYNSIGIKLWEDLYLGIGGDNFGYNMTMGANGKIYVCGKSYNGSGYSFDFIKYNANGTKSWTRSYLPGLGNDETFKRMDVDGSNNLYFIADTTVNSTTNIVIAKGSSSGSLLWKKTFQGIGNTEAAWLAVDHNGGVNGLGRAHNGVNWAVATARYTTAGPHTVSYASAGQKTITLIVANATFSDTLPQTTWVREKPSITLIATPVYTPGGTDGAIDATVTGGTAPYTYLWSQGHTTQDLSGVASGSYSLTVTDANGCTATATDTVTEPPLDIYTAKVQPTSVRLHWTPVPGAHHFAIRGKTVNSSNWVTLNIPGGSVFKDAYGLTNNTTYVWQLIAYGDAAETMTSGWTPIDTFTTGCYAPDSTWASHITSTSARLHWAKAAGAAGYVIRGRRVGSGTYQTLIVNGGATTQKTVYGLLPATA